MAHKITNADRFLGVYNALDEYMKRQLNMDDHNNHTELIHKMCDKHTIFRQFKADLKAFANLRNVIVHNPNSKEANPIAEPHDYIVNKYEEIYEKLTNPPKALESIAVKKHDIYFATMEDKVIDLMEGMKKNQYSHIPIVKEDRLEGVFSENTVFSYLAHNQIAMFETDTAISEFSDFIPLAKHESEYFAFAHKNKLVAEVEEMFQVGLKDNKRIAIVFITESGKEHEKILGMITPWDVVGNKQ